MKKGIVLDMNIGNEYGNDSQSEVINITIRSPHSGVCLKTLCYLTVSKTRRAKNLKVVNFEPLSLRGKFSQLILRDSLGQA